MQQKINTLISSNTINLISFLDFVRNEGFGFTFTDFYYFILFFWNTFLDRNSDSKITSSHFIDQECYLVNNLERLSFDFSLQSNFNYLVTSKSNVDRILELPSYINKTLIKK